MSTAPIEFPPPVDSEKEFVGAPTDPEDERIEVGVAIVGGGPAGLACAIRLSQLLAEDEALTESLGEVPIALVEKGKGPGSHLLSGAMMNPSAMQKLFPDLPEDDWPTFGTVPKDTVYLLPNRKRAIPLKPTPPPFRNHGNHVTSVAQLGRWLSQQAEDAGVYILGETAAAKLLVEDGKVVGVRSGDKGRGRDGEPLSNFEPGSDLIAKATVLAEGTQGHLTGAAIRHFDMGSDDPQQWELGVKEVWEVEQPLDRVIHTMGWPLKFAAKYREFGGSFIYPMGDDKVSMGLVVGLDYRDARFSVHDALQELKGHPLVAKIIEGGKRVAWGAKTIPSGGYWAMPDKLWAPGLILAGDGAGMVNIPKLKGVHLAMHAGMFAAESIYERLKVGGSTDDLSNYTEKVKDVRDRDGHPPLAQHAPAVCQGLPGGRRRGERHGDHRRALPRGPLGHARRRHGGRVHRQGARLPEARRQEDLRQALVGLHHRQRHARRRAQPHPHSGEGAARGRADVAEHVPGAGVRGARGGARGGWGGRQARGEVADHAVELRAVWGHYRQGGPFDAA